MPHYITITPLVDGEYQVTCSQHDLNKKHPSRNIAFLLGHLHVLKIGVDLLNLASAGKADHD
jgi:hypothetical protein